MVAERTRLAREEQKKAAEVYHAEKEAKAATEAPESAPSTEGESLKSESPKKSGWLSTNQWITIGGIGASLLLSYYTREELKAMAKSASDKFKSAFDKFKTPEPAPEPASVEPEPARATRPKGF